MFSRWAIVYSDLKDFPKTSCKAKVNNGRNASIKLPIHSGTMKPNIIEMRKGY